MPLSQFKVENEKAIRLAECKSVPGIMVICGPNGVGKSTLLYCLRKRKGQISLTGQIMYLPPHRAYRRQNVKWMHLWGVKRTYEEVLVSDSLPGFDGVSISSQARSPDSSDEAMSYIKHILSQTDTRRMSGIAKAVDANKGVYPTGSVPDVYGPLRELTRILLPHLRFSRIDNSNPDDVRCLFARAHGGDVSLGVRNEIDLDELSSGERAIIALFLPFIEKQMQDILGQIEGKKDEGKKQKDIVVLIDEPEIHLHPELQSRMLDYLRKIVSDGGAQFIITTHSPTILNAATEEELYLLTPKPEWPDPQNQLIKLVDDLDRLEAIRLLTGATYPITACRSIVCIEGELPNGSTKPTDKRILEILCPELLKNIIVPMGGAYIVVESAERLRTIVPSNIPGLNVFALIDRDVEVEGEKERDWIFRLPVCMLENLLLSPAALFELLRSYNDNPLKSTEEVANELHSIAAHQKADEIRMRVQKKIKQPERIFLGGDTTESIKKSHSDSISRLQTILPSDEELSKIVTAATTEVEAIISSNQELQLFRGKPILKVFYEKYVKKFGFSYLAFCTELAKIVAKYESSNRDLLIAVGHINSYVPAALLGELGTLRAAILPIETTQPEKIKPISSKIGEINLQIQSSIDERSTGKNPQIDRLSIRQEILQVCRTVETSLGTPDDSLKRTLNNLRILAQKISVP